MRVGFIDAELSIGGDSITLMKEEVQFFQNISFSCVISVAMKRQDSVIESFCVRVAM